MLTDDGIQAFTIGCRHILDISHIFQTSFDLKGGGTCLHQLLQVVALVHILQRQQITLSFYLLAIGINQRETHATELRTLTTVGTAMETVF